MKRARVELAVLLAGLVVLPSAVSAQEDDGSMSFSEDEVEEGAPTEKAGSGESGDALFGGGIGDADVAAALGETAAVEGAPAPEAGSETHPIWAVQQVYALRAGRVDIQPSFGFSMNDPYVQHQAISLAGAYYITEVLAAGISFNWYRWLDATTDLNYSVSRATHQTVPINEYMLGAQLNFTYVPIYGKFAMFKEWILHWDVWVLGGGGFIFTRPIPVIDPEYREFDYEMKFCFNVGIGGRLFLTRFLAIYLELRDYIYPEELESLQTFSSQEDRENKDNWLDDDFKLTNNVMLHIGVSLFVPMVFEYKLPK
jgi:outer membrane beta-barrel protein